MICLTTGRDLAFNIVP